MLPPESRRAGSSLPTQDHVVMRIVYSFQGKPATFERDTGQVVTTSPRS